MDERLTWEAGLPITLKITKYVKKYRIDDGGTSPPSHNRYFSTYLAIGNFERNR